MNLAHATNKQSTALAAKERERRTRVDYAQFLRKLADEYFPRAERIVLVQDNLNTHNPTSLYEAFRTSR